MNYERLAWRLSLTAAPPPQALYHEEIGIILEEVYIAVGASFASRHGAEDSDVRCAVAGCGAEDVVAFWCQEVVNAHWGVPSRRF